MMPGVGKRTADVGDHLSREISVKSPEPVGVWRTYQTYEDLTSTMEVTPIGGPFGDRHDRDFPHAVLDGRRRPMLSACLIVRNEQKHLPKCLASIRGVVDEIVVVDTGSSDGTVEVARAFGARVFGFPWRDDFGAARNEAMSHARGEWILCIDADEQLAPVSRTSLARRLLADDAGGYYTLFRRRKRLTPNWQLKLYRNEPGLRHVSVIHEAITSSEIRAVTGRKLGRLPVLIEHEGYDGDMQSRHARNFPLLLKRLESEPDSPAKAHIWCHLADIHEDQGRSVLALRAREHALNLLRKKGRLHPSDCPPYLHILTARAARSEPIDSLFREASEQFPENLQLVWIRGRWLMTRGRYQEAIPSFEQLIAHGENRDFGHWVGYDRRLFDLFSWQSLADCHAGLGNLEASASYRRLAEDRSASGRSDENNAERRGSRV